MSGFGNTDALDRAAAERVAVLSRRRLGGLPRLALWCAAVTGAVYIVGAVLRGVGS